MRVNECWSLVRAEDVYTALLVENAAAVRPGARGSLTYTVEGRSLTASWEIRQNAVWRRGRVFLCCPSCSRLCTRLYLPLETSWFRCRRCWGLTYASRTLQNYKNSLWGGRRFAWMFRTTQREWAVEATAERREEHRRGSADRWAARRKCFA